MPETLYLVDTFSLVFQVYYAIRQPMTGTRGQPTNAVFGFTGDLQHLIKDRKPTHLICAMESPEPGERLQVYEDYKAHREEMPDDLRPQIPLILDVIEGFRIPIVTCPGWEADDVIATLTRQAVERGMEVRIVTNDKDARQLLGPKTKIYSIRKKQFYDEEALLKDWGIRPDQVIDFQSLVGDSVDNVPGVPQVGPKTATTLLNRFQTLEEVLAHPSDAPGKRVQENLVAFADQALMSRELVTLRTDLPIEIDWDAARIHEPNHERLLELFTDFGFRRYSEEFRVKATEAKVEAAQPHSRTWDVIRTQGQFDAFLRELSQQKSVCIDLETTSLNPLDAEIVGWAVCWEADHAWYLPVDGPSGDCEIASSAAVAALKPILEDPGHEVINQNIKYDLLVLRRAGIEVATIGLDPMVGDYLLDAGARTHGLDDLAKRYLVRKKIPISDLIGTGKTQLKMFEVDVDSAAEYASEDADVAWQVAAMIKEKLKDAKLWDLYWHVERPLIPVLADMEWTGIRINVDELQRQSISAQKRLDGLVADIHAEAGREFNIDSPKQLATLLFDDLKLPVLKRTKTGPSTDQDVLERLAAEHALPAMIIEHRMLSKLKGTYLDALPKLVHPKTGRIHCSFNQVVAATGRLSSSDPNLQNIPVRTPEGRLVRRAFIPGQDHWKLVCLDYSQIELRMLAHFCRDDALLSAFAEGRDIHASVAAQVYGVDATDVTPEMRRVAKAVNFGVIYGQTAFGLAAALRISKEEAATFIEGYFKTYAGVERWVNETLDACRDSGYARTILGRRREIVGIRSRRPRNLNLPERTAVNTVIQGSAADLIKQAMINVHRRLKEAPALGSLLLQIHDELVFESPADKVAELVALAKHEMEHALDVSVPIVVDVKVGDNWLDAE